MAIVYTRRFPHIHGTQKILIESNVKECQWYGMSLMRMVCDKFGGRETCGMADMTAFWRSRL